MDGNQIISSAKTKMKQALDHFTEEVKKIRSGRAHAGMLDGIMVEAYGVNTPLNQIASISTPEAQLLQITPYDPNNLAAISTAIRDNPSLGMNPMDDGRVVRLPVPSLTEERRREYVKILGVKTEETMVSLRNVRHEALKEIDQLKKAKSIGEDEAKRLAKQIDDTLSHIKTDIDATAKAKEEEILKV
jgi:ribosome recycling factor